MHFLPNLIRHHSKLLREHAPVLTSSGVPGIGIPAIVYRRRG